MTTDHAATLARDVATFAFRRDPDLGPEAPRPALAPSQLRLAETIQLVHQDGSAVVVEGRARLQRLAGGALMLVVKVRGGRS